MDKGQGVKRLRLDTQGLEPPSIRPPAKEGENEDMELRRAIAEHYDTSEVHAADMTSVLRCIEVVTRLDDARPLLQYSIERQAHFYTVTLKGFTDIIDLDTWYAALRLNEDPHIYSLPYLAINPCTGTLCMRVGMFSEQRGPSRDQAGRIVRKRGRA